jgi:glycosyltransferase involved in cell wall biosynthesis
MSPVLSVIVPAHNPDPARFVRTLQGLRAQTLPADSWETVVVDNASTRFPDTSTCRDAGPANLRVEPEPRLGLSFARMCGFSSAAADIAVLVDDDNVLDPGYLAGVVAIFGKHSRVGIAGGKSLPEFTSDSPARYREFWPLLALRDLGEAELVSAGLRAAPDAPPVYPAYAPLGAGMAIRRQAWAPWLAARLAGEASLADRRGSELTSAGDNDIVLWAMRSGWEVGYFPQLSLRHLIPDSRVEPSYLARLNRGIQKSWMQLLSAHGLNPWPPLSRAGAAARKAKAWFAYGAWASDARWIRWQGACGHFDGRIQAVRGSTGGSA